ncbi:hypothetical protein AN3174.2 [Aspergillus nidulans FGSC A4]|uniref:Uncharacterized protein n=1 Tax=Emericella nidulans (strain FGSC A4 / ATCC 38163 / CBS 112.46 / NRRL 194 / M139) TaxID=227321 RepID=Q5B8F6_EMENI|nr:hypothetical protein [Aspergillus nidulans FGSC A4]EAA63745.1 hypothetical protein AN3174.2 [Aspergillus nidulans FGSC A4]CBF83261.1 TPA: hypothetical protein ANIA_03174 [Aspergillus nidulans FGSC A4]|eukprot:XP_660778.1 hypothetical protein AN3174.2 [Aspergillus nidulans FGSC A4]
MRTRSQPDSPGGFVSLDDNKRATRRTTRSTRSASRAVSQEPTSEQPAEPTTQPATRSKTQARTTKKTTTKKATSTTSTAKPQTRKGARRGTRSATRRAEHNATEEVQESVEKNTHDTVRTDNKENVDVNTGDLESRPLASDSALMEPKNSERVRGYQVDREPIYADFSAPVIKGQIDRPFGTPSPKGLTGLRQVLRLIPSRKEMTLTILRAPILD